ncbi:MAG: helicase-associated domain-containing protein [Egibacteraceae bacterium]
MSLFVADRLEALAHMTAADLGWLLGRVPAVTEMVRGGGQLALFGIHHMRGQAGEEPSLGRLAALLASPAGIDLVLASLNRFEYQLVRLAAWHGGTLAREQALAETGPAAGALLDESAGSLARLLLSDQTSHWVRLRPGVAELIRLPGARARDWLEHETTDVLASKIRRLGGQTPARKTERVDALVALLQSREAIQAAIAAMPEEVRRIFWLLVEHGTHRVRDLGIPYYLWYGANTPLHWLDQRGLVGVDPEDQVAWVWTDVMIALNGRLFADWSPGPAVVHNSPPLQDAAGLPLVLGYLTSLLEIWAAEPAPVLATGALGVRPVRAAAKALGLAAGEVGLLAHLAIELRLLGRVLVSSKGKGRNRVDTWGWAPTDLVAAWEAEQPARRWALLVQTWQDSPSLNELHGLPERWDSAELSRVALVSRMTFLRLLAEIPPERGMSPANLVEWAGFAYPMLLDAQRTRGLTEAARVLGLVPATGPVGLTSLGRALLDSPEAVEAAMPAPRTEFTIQADHTVIAPPDLAVGITAQLERYADLESAAGARIYRLSERRVATALDDGDTAAEILDFLERYSTVPVAQNVAHLISDLERRHGQLRAGSAQSYLRCDDPALLTGALGVKAAKLHLLAPTVAVSPLAADKLVTALRTRGSLPVLESPGGAILERPAMTATTTTESLPPLREQLVLPDGAGLIALAKAILDNP